MPEHPISVERLQVGLFVRLDLKWFEHPFLFGSFKIKNHGQIQAIRDLGLAQVFCVPEKSDPQALQALKKAPATVSRTGPPTPPANAQPLSEKFWKIKKERIRKLQERNLKIQHCERQYNQTYNQVKDAMQELVTGSEIAAEKAGAIVHQMVESILSEREVVLHMINVKAKDEGVFYHSLNVAILALFLGREYGLEAATLEELGVGALFHDIGKHRIPKKILYKQTPLTSPERQLIRLHPVYGEEIAGKIRTFPPEALKVIRQHHETNDGEGFPNRLKSQQISPLAKVMAIANVYDNYCNQLNPQDSMTPHEALSYMFGRMRNQLDAELLTLFIRCLGVYPPGTILQLSNDLIGIVVSVNPGNQLRPSLLVYDPEIPPKEALVYDLDEDPDISILRSIRPSQLPAEVFAYLNPRARITYYFDASQKIPSSGKA